MKAWKSILFLSVAMIHFQVYAVAEDNPSSTGKPVGKNQEIIEKIIRLEKGIASFKCDFENQIFLENLIKPKKEEGTIAFKAPSFWRLEQFEPGSKTPFFMAGCNGKILWKNDKEDMNPDIVAKADVENISIDQQNGLLFQTAGFSPFFPLNEGWIAKISSVTDGQDNTWVFEIMPDGPVSSRIPSEIKIDKMKFEISKETGLVKANAYFTEGKLLISMKFKYTKIDTALIAH